MVLRSIILALNRATYSKKTTSMVCVVRGKSMDNKSTIHVNQASNSLESSFLNLEELTMNQVKIVFGSSIGMQKSKKFKTKA